MISLNGFSQHPAGWVRRFVAAALAGHALLLSLPALAGTVVTREVNSSALGRSWSYAVYLPHGYETSDFDPAVWKAYNYPALWDAYLAKKIPVPMYINSGDDDFFIESEVTQFYELLRKNKQPAQLRIVDGAHVWARRVSRAGTRLAAI